MSLQLVIPRRVALQQSSPPLHQLSVILKEKRKFEKEKPWNSKCANSKLSQRRGSPHHCVRIVCQRFANAQIRKGGNLTCGRLTRIVVEDRWHFSLAWHILMYMPC